MARKMKKTRGKKGILWVKRDSSGEWHIARDVDNYGTFRGQKLPPPGRNNIIVRTPNPLPSPKEVVSK